MCDVCVCTSSLATYLSWSKHGELCYTPKRKPHSSAQKRWHRHSRQRPPRSPFYRRTTRNTCAGELISSTRNKHRDGTYRYTTCRLPNGLDAGLSKIAFPPVAHGRPSRGAFHGVADPRRGILVLGAGPTFAVHQHPSGRSVRKVAYVSSACDDPDDLTANDFVRPAMGRTRPPHPCGGGLLDSFLFLTRDRSSTKCPSRVHIIGHGSVIGPALTVGEV